MKFRSSFHAVILLISLSLAGIIFFQYHWLYTMLMHNHRTINQKIVTGIHKAWGSIAEKKNNGYIGTDTSLRADFNIPATQIRMALLKAFSEQKLSGLRFEYALSADADIISSPGFRIMVRDSGHNKVQSFIFLPAHDHPDHTKKLTVLVTGIRGRLLRDMNWLIAAAVLGTCIIIVIFCIMLNAIIRQRKLNRLRQYFINNMAEAFATPLSAISLAADALGNEKVRQDKTRLDYFSTVIKEENSRLQKHMEAVLHTPLKLYRAALWRIRRKT